MIRLIAIVLISLMGLILHIPLWAATPVVVVEEPVTQDIVEPTVQDNASLTDIDQRIRRIERVLDNRVILEMLRRVENLQEEIRELRGEVENWGFELQLMQKRQRDLYLDTDRRLRDLELTSKVPLNLVTTANTDGNRTDGKADTTAADATTADLSTGDATSISDDSVVVTPSPSVDTGGEPSVLPIDLAQEKAAYTDAFNYLKEGHYEGAIKAFSQFLREFPDGNYADNAQYWLGEANYVSRFFDAAIEAFNAVLAQYPTSSKLSDARLKIGYAYYELENWEAARSALNYLEQNFPGTSAAHLAAKRLARMRDEGH